MRAQRRPRTASSSMASFSCTTASSNHEDRSRTRGPPAATCGPALAPGTSRAMSCVTAWSPSMLRNPSSAAYSAAASCVLKRSRRTLNPSTTPTPPPAPGNVTRGTPARPSASRSRAIVRVDTSNRSASAPMVVRCASASTHMIPMSRSIRIGSPFRVRIPSLPCPATPRPYVADGPLPACGARCRRARGPRPSFRQGAARIPVDRRCMVKST